MQTMTCLLAGNWRAATRSWGNPPLVHADPQLCTPPAVVYATSSGHGEGGRLFKTLRRCVYHV